MGKYLERRKRLEREGRDRSPEGFDFDADDIEQLVDSFTPKDEIPLILEATAKQMDEFCRIAYGMDWTLAYDRLFAKSMQLSRQMISYLAKEGHTKALEIVARNFMKLDQDGKARSLRIQVVNDLDDEEEEDGQEAGK